LHKATSLSISLLLSLLIISSSWWNCYSYTFPLTHSWISWRNCNTSNMEQHVPQGNALETEFTGSYNKSQQDALFLKFILIKISTCFRQIYCPSWGVSALYTQQQVFV
jgi:hypothetical protein